MRSFFAPILILGVAFTHAPLVAAQDEGPQQCGQETNSADYGPIQTGSVVVPQRHRFVDGDANWDQEMGRFLGRAARVARLSGVDDQGCPGVRLDVDGEANFWRIRDINVGDARPGPTPPERHADSATPQRCGQTEGDIDYGNLHIGSVVVVGRHRPTGGAENWTPQMTPYIGRTATIVELAGVDEDGCPGVHIDADAREWFWRVRDMTPADTSGGGVAYRPGMASDHGRPGAPRASGADTRIPQACSMTDDDTTYGPVGVGTEVIIGRHRPVGGSTNWVEDMDPFVGLRGRVTELIGVDEEGCPLVAVDVDDGDWLWRIRDMRLP